MSVIKLLLSSALILLSLQSAWGQGAFKGNHQAWNTLLKENVVMSVNGFSSSVNYAGFAKQQSTLTHYLNSLSDVNQATFDGWSKDEQLAFLINAYNAWTVALILTSYPDLESIKDLGSFFNPPWGKSFFTLFGKKHSLNDIEHELIRGSGRYNDPRIHFAVNCASIGCPALRNEAYVSGQLNDQLNQQTLAFLSDNTRNRLSKDTLEVSSIFKWYKEDFEQGWMGFNSLEDVFIKYAHVLMLSTEDVKKLKAGDFKIDYLDYDWSLNDVR
jgi:hypothetical protein